MADGQGQKPEAGRVKQKTGPKPGGSALEFHKTEGYKLSQLLYRRRDLDRRIEDARKANPALYERVVALLETGGKIESAEPQVEPDGDGAASKPPAPDRCGVCGLTKTSGHQCFV